MVTDQALPLCHHCSMPHVVIFNGSLSGVQGNTAVLLAEAELFLTRAGATVTYIDLNRDPSLQRVLAEAEKADAFLFGTGTYWDSWGSPMQKFLEETAATEGEDVWLGKPAGILVTAHAVGGKGVLSRLMGILNVYGMAFPPFAGMCYTYVNHHALPSAPEGLVAELWKFEDVRVVCANLLEYLRGGNQWQSWGCAKVGGIEKWLDRDLEVGE